MKRMKTPPAGIIQSHGLVKPSAFCCKTNTIQKRTGRVTINIISPDPKFVITALVDYVDYLPMTVGINNVNNDFIVN